MDKMMTGSGGPPGDSISLTRYLLRITLTPESTGRENAITK
jgi:hypothetical protein